MSASPRGSRLITRLLDLCMPGVGLFYWERKARGSRIIVSWVAFVMFVLASWLWSPFHSDLLCLYIGLPWLSLTLWLWHEVSIVPPAALLWVRHVDRVTTSLGLVVLSWLPILLTLQLIFSRALMYVRIYDDSMFPTLISGDLIAVDRRATRPSELKLGSLVAVECRGVGPTIMRLIAYNPRQSLNLQLDELGNLKLSEQQPSPPEQRSAKEAIQEGLSLLDQILRARMDESEQLEAWLLKVADWAPAERGLLSSLLWSQALPLSSAVSSTRRAHLMAVPKYQDPKVSAQRLFVPQGQLLVIPDIRERGARAMNCAGPTPISRLLGEVIYVQSQDREAYARRRGLSLLR